MCRCDVGLQSVDSVDAPSVFTPEAESSQWVVGGARVGFRAQESSIKYLQVGAGLQVPLLLKRDALLIR